MVAIKIAELLAKNNKVYVLPWWSERPTSLKDNLIINNVKYLRRRVSLDQMMNIIKLSPKLSFKTAFNYAFGLSKIKYSLMYLFDRAYIELLLEQLEIDVIHIHGVHLSYLPYIDAAIEKEIPLVCTSHGLSCVNPDIYLDYDKSYEKYALERISRAKHTGVTAVSTTLKDKIITMFNVSAEKIHVILNGIDYERFGIYPLDKSETRKRFDIPIDKAVILQVGVLSKRKNHIAVLKAIAEMNKEIKDRFFYAIVGAGSERDNLITFCKENAVMNCSFFGWVNEVDLVQLFLISDFLILPSTSEGLPLVFAEAIGAGLPIITFKDLDGVSDLYNEHNMELISERNTESMIMAIRQAIGRDWERSKIKEHSYLLSWDNICESYHELYFDLWRHKWEK